MKRYIIATVELEPQVIVLSCGANDMQWMVTLECITHEIVVLETSVKTNMIVVLISDIISRKDRYKDKTKECLKMFENVI